MVQEKVFRFCPSCSSLNVKEHFVGEAAIHYQCLSCQYLGPVLEGNKNFIELYRKKVGVSRGKP